MPQLLFVKFHFFSLFSLLSLTLFSQNQSSGGYISFSPNIQFVSITDKPDNDLKAFPFFGGYLNGGYTKVFNKHIYTDINLGYNAMTYRYAVKNTGGGSMLLGRIETDFNIGYINTINERKDLLVHVGYGFEPLGLKDTIYTEYDNLSTVAFGADKGNMYMEIGFGIFHHQLFRNFYTGISFKKGFVKSNEMQLYFNDNNTIKFYRIVSFQDNLSFNFKYYFRKTKKRAATNISS